MRNGLMAMLLVFGLSFLASAQAPPTQPLPSVVLPPEVDRVLRDYEKAWQARDAAALAALFTEDGFVLSNGKPAVRGRAAIKQAYAEGGGPLALRAFAYSLDGATGYIIGAYAGTKDSPDEGKFILALRRDRGGRWLIAADIDNTNSRPKRPAAPPSQ
jgi:ketosteroid isomerase-like protein